MQVNLVPFSGGPALGLLTNKRPLGKREQEIIQLVMQGYRNRDIARILSTSELTVDNCLHVIFEKLAVSNRLELALYTVHNRIINQSDAQPPAELLSNSWLGGYLRKAWARLRWKQRGV